MNIPTYIISLHAYIMEINILMNLDKGQYIDHKASDLYSASYILVGYVCTITSVKYLGLFLVMMIIITILIRFLTGDLRIIEPNIKTGSENKNI